MTRVECPTPAIVLDADRLCQIAAIQDLGRRGIPVVAIAASPAAIGLRSRYVSRKIVCPTPSHRDEYAAFLLAQAPRGVLFYSNDANAEMVSRNSRMLSEAGFSFLISEPGVLRRLIHKEQLFLTAAGCGVRVPRSRLVSPAEAGREANEIGFPCILKSTNLAGGVYEPLPGPASVPAAVDRMQAVLASPEWRHRCSDLMVQEWIPQDGATLWNFNALVKGGEILSYAMGRRIRTDVRRDGAIGSLLLYGVTDYNSAVHDANRRLLRHVRYDGIMETEWSLNGNDPERLYLYDFNPRPSGNFRWTLKSGVPMATQYYQACTGQAVTGNRRMSPGVAYYKILTRQNDFLWALANPAVSRHMKAHIFLEDVRALLRPGRAAIDVLDTDDLGPTLGACRDLAAHCWRRALAAVGKRLRAWPQARNGGAQA